MDRQTALIHGRLASTRRRWERAEAMVAEHLAAAPCSYVSWSGGKDSTAVALLATAVDPGVPVVRRSRGVDFPEVVDYCADLAGRHGWRYLVAVGDVAETYLPRVSIDHAPSKSRHRAEAVSVLGFEPDGLLYGLRADESRDRAKLLYSTRGRWVSAAGDWVCAPCWDWSALDVVAYLVHRGEWWCPVYDRLVALGAPPGSWRVGYMVGSGGGRHGRYRWLKAGWPEEWARLAELVPWLREVS